MSAEGGDGAGPLVGLAGLVPEGGVLGEDVDAVVVPGAVGVLGVGAVVGQGGHDGLLPAGGAGGGDLGVGEVELEQLADVGGAVGALGSWRRGFAQPPCG